MFKRLLPFLIVFLIADIFSQSVNMPLEHWAYRFLQRMEAKGLFHSNELRVRPVPRDKLAEILEEIYRSSLEHPEKLSKTDTRLLHQLMSDFSDELEDKGVSDVGEEIHLFRIKESVGTVYGDLLGQQAIISNRGRQFNPDQLLSETTLGGQLRGHLGNTIGFFAEARNSLTRGEERDPDDENFDPSQGSPVVVSGANVFRDRATAYFVWEQPWLRLEMGKDEFDWGPGYHGSATLTRNAPPADMIRLGCRFKRFKFTCMHSWLRSPLGSKYLAGHRLDFTVFRGLYLAASETVVYGNRNVELSYLNPLMLYHIAEHHLGDRDNNNLSFDVTYTRIPNLTLYGEWFIDDMTSTQSWSQYFGNKFAWVFGGLWTDPFGLNNVDLRCEYGRISPYVYSHEDSINIYTHYDKIIGHWLGPNGDTIFLELGWRLSRDFQIQLFGEMVRKGEGDADTVSQPAQGDRKDFLKGVLEKRTLVGVKLVDQIRRDMFVALSYTYQDTQNLKLGPEASYDHLARFQFYFNY